MEPSESAAFDDETTDAPHETSAPETAQLKDELAKMRDQWLRAVAETENIRKRAQRDVEETGKYAVSGFARDLVNVVENLQRARDSITPEAAKQDSMLANMREGVEMTLRELLNTFERNGIRRIDPLGQKFDHNFHQAVAQVPAPDAAPGTVVQVMQAGYTIHDRLLRPAMVAVAQAQSDMPKTVDTVA